MLVKDKFYVPFKNNYNKIKIILELYRVYRHGTGNFNLELINENFVNIAYLDKNDISLKIDTNEGNISSNLGKITTNEGNISSNLGKITSNEGNISSNLGKITTNEGNISSNLGKITTNEGNISSNLGKITTNEGNISSNLSEITHIKNTFEIYLKNIYNILIYGKKTQIDFRNIFYEKIYDFNAKQNDFIEMPFKFEIEYQDTDDRHYVKIIYELFDKYNNSLYVKSLKFNNYIYSLIIMTIDNNIFYNFIKDIK